MTQDHTCCDKIIKIEQQVKGHADRIDNLETLYTPVAQLKTLFIICIFILTGIFALTGYIWKTVDESKGMLIKLDVDMKNLKSNIRSAKKVSLYNQDLLKEQQ
jgi:hypothetical protein